MASTVAGSSLAKHLASCNKTTRDKALRLLKTWLPSNASLPEDEMKKIWKGLFYSLWHADKQQFQLELINRLSSLLLSLNPSLSLHYFTTFLLTIRREWAGIDYLRLDKFYLLIRRFMHNMFALFKKKDWDLEFLGQFMCVLEEKTLFSNDKFPAQGVNYHIAEVFAQELKPFLPVKVEVVEVLVRPFVSVMGKSLDKVLLGKIKSGLFGCLLENGKKCLERKKGGSGGEDSGVDEVEVFGTIALTLGFSEKFFELGSSEDCVQGNRKVLFGLHEEFGMLEKDMASSGVKISIPEVNNVGDEEEVPQLIPITQGGVDKSDKPPKKKIKKVQSGTVSEQVKENQAANGLMDKPSKKIKKDKKVVVEQDGENQVANGSMDKPSKKIKKDKKVVLEQLVESQVANGSMDKKSNKIKKDKNASGGSGSKKSKKRRDPSPGSDFLEGDDGTCNEENLTNEGGSGSITFNECVISNLQMEFEKIAAEAGMDTSSAVSFDSPATSTIRSVPKKRKRAKSIDGQVSHGDGLFGQGGVGGSALSKSGEKSAKKVRFSMKNNLVWKPHSPLPPQSLRLPPSATPRGSALKKGIPAGPVIESSGSSMSKKVKRRSSSLKKARKGLKSVSPSVKRLKKLRPLSA